MRAATVHAVTDTFDTGLEPQALDPKRPLPLETPWGSFALYVVDGQVRAAQRFCPHLLGPLFQGTLKGDVVMCPWHFWCFSLTSGKRVDFAGRVLASGTTIELLPVSLSERGTIVLHPPKPAT